MRFLNVVAGVFVFIGFVMVIIVGYWIWQAKTGRAE